MRRGAGLLLVLALLIPTSSCHRGSKLLRPAGPPAGGWGATFRCTLQRPPKERRFRMVLGVRPPDRFRLEIYGPVGGARLVVASDGRRLAAAAPAERLHAEADASPQAFGALLGLPLPGEDLLGLLEGRPADGSKGSTRVLPGGGKVRYDHRREDGLLVETRVEILLPGDGPRRLQVRYADHRLAGGRWLPHDVQVLGQGESLLLRRGETVPGGPLEAAFRVAVPPGFERVDLARLGEAGARLFGEAE